MKIHNPYDFDKDSIWLRISMANCLVGFSRNVENSVKTILNINKHCNYRPVYIEIGKEEIGH